MRERIKSVAIYTPEYGCAVKYNEETCGVKGSPAMNKPMQIIAVKKQSMKKPIPEYDPTDIDFSVRMVNEANRQREAEMRKQERRRQIRLLNQREADVKRRELIVSQKEAEQKAFSNVIGLIADGMLIASSVAGIIVTIWFCMGL